MFQEFFKDTLVSRFIKRLIRSTNLPNLSIIEHNDYIIKDCSYIYKGYIVKALTSGQFCIDPDRHFGEGTYYTDIPGEIESDTDGKITRAAYEVVDKYDEENKQHSYNFHSRFMYYDPETHYHLGEYLRYIRDREGINLMPYYNCFSAKTIAKITLVKPTSNRSFEAKSSDQYKLYAVPVKFGKTYTIAIDSNSPVQMNTLVYNDDCGCIVKDSNVGSSQIEYYSDDIDCYELFTSLDFNKPIIKDIPEADNADLYAQQKNLYLIIQVSKNHSGSVVVLEGNYAYSWGNVVSNLGEYKDETLFYKNLSLLHFPTSTSYAFSDRLIEYLLLGIINKTERLDGNISYLQELLGLNTCDGIWDDSLRENIHLIEKEALKNTLIRDLDGYLNKDIEKLLRQTQNNYN